MLAQEGRPGTQFDCFKSFPCLFSLDKQILSLLKMVTLHLSTVFSFENLLYVPLY